ncbi:MAG: L-histidine N(alpha)-methyltransferase [Planctomycetota bacterium]
MGRIEEESGGRASTSLAATLGDYAREGRFELVGTPASKQDDAFAEAVRAGLQRSPKRIPARFLYDDRGSALFERICELDEYYPTRAEREILRDRASEIVALFDEEPTLVEYGSGSAEKTEHLIEALLDRFGKLHYAPIDISRAAIEHSAADLLAKYDDLHIVGVWGEYERGLLTLERLGKGPRLILWLGSNIGNLLPSEATTFLTEVAERMRDDDRLLVGVDLVKDEETLVRAYDDAEGVTAAFTFNLIERVRRELGGTLDPANFRYVARWNRSEHRIEAYLECTRPHVARVEALDLDVAFARGERIGTEYAHKYTPEGFDRMAREAKLDVVGSFTDRKERFRSVVMRRKR